MPTRGDKFTHGGCAEKVLDEPKLFLRLTAGATSGTDAVQTRTKRGPNAITRAMVVDNTWSPAITRESSAGNRGWSTFRARLFGVCTASPALVIVFVQCSWIMYQHLFLALCAIAIKYTYIALYRICLYLCS